ncbi:MAG: UvrD-helicase domain-containing protein [Armatimonadetes bacterium]|nr:UvrD-helicase domain-containing protein [Armatimonadota bacterium]
MDDFPPPPSDEDDPFADYEAYVPPPTVTLHAPAFADREGDAPHVPDPNDPLLVRLNPSQQEAVIHKNGPLLIFAGAGSGKTRVLTHRIAYLTGRYGVWPRQILAVTFTNKAATEMKERLIRLLGEEAIKSMWVGTFHATCARMLRERGKDIGLVREFTVYDDGDQIMLMKECLSQLNLDDRQYAPRAVLSLISKAKEKLVAPEQFGQVFHGVFESVVAKLYKLYQEKLTQNRAVDFDDLIMLSVRLLEQREDVREYYQNKFRYVLVDEYQDINNAQYKLVSLLSGKWGNLCVVGDEDQCLPPGTLIATPMGEVPVETVVAGDPVLAANGEVVTVMLAKEMQFRGELVTITTSDGKVLRATPEHLVFARLDPKREETYYAYCRTHTGGYFYSTNWKGSGEGIAFADIAAAWIRDVSLYPVEESDGSEVAAMSAETASLHDNLCHHGLNPSFPHFRSFGASDVVTFHQYTGRKHCVGFVDHQREPSPQGGTVYEYGGTRTQSIIEQALSRLFDVNHGNVWGSDTSYVEGWDSKRKQWQCYFWTSDYDTAIKAVKIVRETLNITQTDHLACFGRDLYQAMPMSHVRVGMLMRTTGRRKTVSVIATGREPYDGAVYDLEVAKHHNYQANGLLVHNSVYSWRGADVSIILRFDRDFKDAKVIKLEQNYRSTQTILDAAYNVVRNNRGRKDKKLWTENPAGDQIHLFEAMNEQEEAVFVADKVLAATQTKQRELSDFAILYRTNAQSRTLEEVLNNYRVPYKIIGGVRFYERREIKDLVCYLRLVQNPFDSVSLRRVINVPARGIGAGTWQKMELKAQVENLSLWEVVADLSSIEGIRASTRKAMESFVALIATARGQSGSGAWGVTKTLTEIIENTGYVRDLEKERTIEANTRIENIRELMTATQQFEATTEDPTLYGFLEQTALIADVDALEDADTNNRVVLMTLHAAKGLEFPVVFLVGLEEGVFPHSRSLQSDSELEEERRLAYVGITRAKEELFLTYATRRTIFGNTNIGTLSRFVREVPVELLKLPRALQNRQSLGGSGTSLGARMGATRDEYSQVPASWDESNAASRAAARAKGAAKTEAPLKIGDKAKHAVFGVGVIVSLSGTGDDALVSIAFPNIGVKKLALGYARLEKV